MSVLFQQKQIPLQKQKPSFCSIRKTIEIIGYWENQEIKNREKKSHTRKTLNQYCSPKLRENFLQV